MNVQDSANVSRAISQLIKALTKGEMNPSDFRIEINRYSQTMAKNLFRDNFPQFISNLKSKITDVFIRYFFNDGSYQTNDLWKFVDFKDFWLLLQNFHDNIYNKNMILNEVIQFFEENLSDFNNKPNLSFLEQKVIEQLDQSPTLLNKDLAKHFEVSEKTISNLMTNLRTKGISLGSSVDYCALDCFEFFTFGDNSLHEDVYYEYTLFPSFSLCYGISSERIRNPLAFNVIDKRVICNTRVLNMGISLKDWNKHPIMVKRDDLPIQKKENPPFYITPISKDYILQLAKNCETDFKRPHIKRIADLFDVSIRTLFRIKSKLKDRGILEPKMVLEMEDLMTVLIISDNELLDFYNKVPYIRAYEVQDFDKNIKWITFLSIFPRDFNFIYRKNSKSLEMYQVIGRKTFTRTPDSSGSLLHSKQKT
jgi:hypothetical protein